MENRRRVMFFCLGNICRSPLAEALFRFHVQERGLEDQFEIQSSGTGNYHVGEAPDPGSVKVAKERLRLDISGQRAQQLKSDDLAYFDFVVAMDRSNLANARRLPGSKSANLLLLRDFEPQELLRGTDVPDPWGYGSDHFEEVYEIVHRCTARFLDEILDRSRPL